MVLVETGELWERGQLGRSSRRWLEMDMNMVDQFIWWLIAKGVHISSVCTCRWQQPVYVKLYILKRPVVCKLNRDSSLGMATLHELDGQEIDSWWGEFFRACPERSWGPPKFPYNGYRVSFPGVKRSGRGVKHTPV